MWSKSDPSECWIDFHIIFLLNIHAVYLCFVCRGMPMVWSSKAELTKNKESWVFQVVLEGQGFWEMGTFRKALRIYHFADINNWRNDLQL